MSIVVKIENLAKSYRIRHEDRALHATTFRETIVNVVRDVFKKKKKIRLIREDFWALKDINLEVKNQDRVGIIGKNGAGKSTLLKVLSRITEPTKGKISIKGRIASLLEVGTGFHSELTGRENIYLNGAVLGMRKWEIKKKFDEIVGFAEIEKFLDTPVKRYSSGMYVRLAFAVAAHLEPEILLVDEVLAVGDIPFQKKCLGKMSDIAKGGRTIVFVSHNMQAIKKLCSRVIILDKGRIVMDGIADEGIAKYLGEGIGLKGERDWSNIESAPGDGVVRLVSARVLDKNGDMCVNYDVQEQVDIQIEYRVLEEGHHLHTHFSFTNEIGQTIFVSKDNLDSPWKDAVCPIGSYRAICHIPGNFLNEGEFSVYCAITTVGMGNLGHVSEQDLVIFKVSDKMDRGGVRGNYPLHWDTGGVRPRLSWVIKKTN